METFENITKDIISNSEFDKLKEDLHHGITRYAHSYRVAKWTYRICKFFKMKKTNETVRAALLHDFYVNEDLEGLNSIKRLSAHPSVALKNALKYYKLDNLEQNIIEAHMFPCNLKIPKYKEAVLVSVIDKTVATYEMIRYKIPLYLGIYSN